jgi:5'-3' exonuclease
LVHREKLAVLENTRIGVDAFTWLKNHVTVSELFNAAMGGSPITLFSKIQKEIELFKKYKIKPIFVFNGLTGLWKEDLTKNKPTNEKDYKRNMAWMTYESGAVKEAATFFIGLAQSPIEYVHVLIKYFAENDIEYFRAPYLSWGQLARFEQRDKPVVHAIYGSFECTMFNVQRLITEIHFELGSFDYIEKQELLSNLQLRPDQYVDACIAIGSHLYRPTGIVKEMGAARMFHQSCNNLGY